MATNTLPVRLAPAVDLMVQNYLMLVQGYITESLAEVETSLDETREDSGSPDWQYFKGQKDALKDLRKYIERKAQELR